MKNKETNIRQDGSRPIYSECPPPKIDVITTNNRCKRHILSCVPLSHRVFLPLTHNTPSAEAGPPQAGQTWVCPLLGICFDLNHSIVAVVVCLGMLSRWGMNLRPNLKSVAAYDRVSSRIILYLVPSNFPSPQHDAATTMFHGGDGVFRWICRFPLHTAFCL